MDSIFDFNFQPGDIVLMNVEDDKQILVKIVNKNESYYVVSADEDMLKRHKIFQKELSADQPCGLAHADELMPQIITE